MRIQLNSQWTDTAAETVYTLRARLYGRKEMVTVINGFQTDQDRPLLENDQIVFIEKGTMPDRACLRSMMAARHTPGVLEKFEKAQVGIAGLGGLGSHIAMALARTGIGQLHLVDFDSVEPSNLNRQVYTIEDLGKAKTEALKTRLKAVNPFIEIKTDTVKVTEANAHALFQNDSIVCEAFDHPESKAMLINVLLEKNKDTVIVAASGMAGIGNCNAIQTRQITERLYLCGDGKSEAKEGCGLMAPRVMVCAGHQADMVLQILLNNNE